MSSSTQPPLGRPARAISWVAMLVVVAFPHLARRVASAPPAISGRISGGFQAPTSTDSQGRRHVLKGTNAEPRGKDVYLITEPRVVSYNPDDSPEMFTESPRCVLEMKSNIAHSDGALSVRTADGRFSIEGTGWRWDLAQGELLISNQVVAFVKKSVLSPPGGGQAQAQTATNPPVRITAESFRQKGDQASFRGHVLVEDQGDRLLSDRLELEFAKPGGLQRIDALGNVRLDQGQTRVESGRASYELKEDIIRISEQPRWNMNQREGSSERLILNRALDTLWAEGNVYMKLPMTNLAAPAGDIAANPPGTNQFMEVFSGNFKFIGGTTNRTPQAEYRDRVRVNHPRATIFCSLLAVDFDAKQRLTRVEARENVEVRSEGRRAFGQTALYDLAEEKITLEGDPRWEIEERSGSSDRLVFSPRTRETLALGHVRMLIPGDFAASRSNGEQPAATHAPMTIRASRFSQGPAAAIFEDQVEVIDGRGALNCDKLTILTGPTNRIERIIAERNVAIRQRDLIATGARAEYEPGAELVHLTGCPELLSADKKLSAERFIINRRLNSFSVAPGKYRIQLQLSGHSTRRGK